MKKFVLVVGFILCAGYVSAQPGDRFSLTHSTHIASGDVPTTVSLATGTIRRGDFLKNVVVTSTGTTGVSLTIRDGMNDDAAGATLAYIDFLEAGTYPFEIFLTSGATITKAGDGTINVLFYISHPVGN